jgi:hypothetical protein
MGAKGGIGYACQGLPSFRDPKGRPIAKPSMIDEYIVGLNQWAAGGTSSKPQLGFSKGLEGAQETKPSLHSIWIMMITMAGTNVWAVALPRY